VLDGTLDTASVFAAFELLVGEEQENDRMLKNKVAVRVMVDVFILFPPFGNSSGGILSANPQITKVKIVVEQQPNARINPRRASSTQFTSKEEA
jgi:hypothetical protein